MQTSHLKSICLIRSKDHLNGFPACLALLKRSLNTNLNVHALLFIHLQKDLPPFFRENYKFKVSEFFAVESLEELRKYLDIQNISKSSLIFIDSLSLLIEQLSLPSTSLLLNQLSELSACVLALIDNASIIEEEEWRRLESISTTIFQLELADGDENGHRVALCKTMNRKKDETFDTMIEQFVIQPDYSIQTSEYRAPDPVTKIAKELQALSTHNEKETAGTRGLGRQTHFGKLPFDVGLNLSEQERRAKANVQLPYMAAQSEKGLVGLNMASGKKLRAGGQIIYTPDKEDDFDESDPDEDLTI